MVRVFGVVRRVALEAAPTRVRGELAVLSVEGLTEGAVGGAAFDLGDKEVGERPHALVAGLFTPAILWVAAICPAFVVVVAGVHVGVVGLAVARFVVSEDGFVRVAVSEFELTSFTEYFIEVGGATNRVPWTGIGHGLQAWGSGSGAVVGLAPG